MELTYLMGRIRESLNETGHGTFFTDADLNDSLEDGYTLICLFTGLLDGFTELTIEADKVYYDLSSLDPYVRPVAVYDPNTKLFLKPISAAALHRNILGWETVVGAPMFFCYFPTKLIAFHPHYYSVPGIPHLDLYYKKWQNDFDSLATIDLPKFAENCIVNYCVSDLYDQLLETQKSTIYWNRFVEELQMCKRKISSRAVSTPIMRGEYGQPSIYR